MKTKKEKLKQNNLSRKKIGLQIKIIKETKKLEIGAEKNTMQKKLFCVAKILLA